MMGDPPPRGRTWQEPISTYDLASALTYAQRERGKFWFRLRGDTKHLYEVYMGGRNIAWPLEMLEARRRKQGPLHADHRCKHVWERHTDSDPVAAGVHIEEWRQCLKCGEIRDPKP
jgi:hypothetical protein